MATEGELRNSVGPILGVFLDKWNGSIKAEDKHGPYPLYLKARIKNPDLIHLGEKK